MQHLEIYLVQADLTWQNEAENLRHLGHLISEIPLGSVIVLPEMFATGFTMNPEQFSTPMDGASVSWMKSQSRDRVICGSLAVVENNKYYNRFLWVENGEIKAVYDKRHLFGFGREDQHYSAGVKTEIIEYQGWRIKPFVCYDLRFPVWCRNTESADLILFVANWPQVRVKAWTKLLQARAIENQCFVAGVNRVGEDGNGVYHNGQSGLCDPWGEWLTAPSDEEKVMHFSLDKQGLIEFRKHFPVLNDRDQFQIL